MSGKGTALGLPFSGSLPIVGRTRNRGESLVSRRRLEVLPLVFLPLFIGSNLVVSRLAWPETAAVLAPIAFYCSYALYVSHEALRRAERWQARLESQVMLRLEELTPSHAKLSRVAFEAALEQEISRSRRHSLSFCVVTVKLPLDPSDKSSNTLRVVAWAAHTLRQEDVIGRLDRTTFAIGLPHTTPSGAAVVMARLVQAFGQQKPAFGIACLSQDVNMTAREMIKRALSRPVRLTPAPE